MHASEPFARLVLTAAALAAVLLWLPGCEKSPQRRGPKNYREYKAMKLGLETTSQDTAEISSDDGDYGPTSGSVPETAGATIRGGTVPDTGSIKGTVKFDGDVIPPKKVTVSKDPWCQGNATVFTENFLVGAGGGLQNCAVYVAKGFNRFDFEPPSEPALIDQNGCKYIPHVLTLMAGQDVAIRNSDGTSHNYNVKTRYNEPVNKTQPDPTTDILSIFQNPDLECQFRCDIHSWMFAPTRVFGHPYFTVTDEGGRFEIKNVPPGRYLLAFLHERKSIKYVPVEVEVKAGEAAELEVVNVK